MCPAAGAHSDPACRADRALQTSHYFNDFLMPLYQGPAFNAPALVLMWATGATSALTPRFHPGGGPNNVPATAGRFPANKTPPRPRRRTVHAGKVPCAAAIDSVELLACAKRGVPEAHCRRLSTACWTPQPSCKIGSKRTHAPSFMLTVNSYPAVTSSLKPHAPPQ